MLSKLHTRGFKFRILSLMLIIVFLFVHISPVYSDLEEEEKKLAQYKAQLQEIKKNIKNVEQAQKEISILINNMTSEISSLETQIKITQGKIEELTVEIGKKEEEIKAKENIIHLREAELNDAINLSYQLSYVSPVELFYEGSAPEVVYKRLTYISYISSYTEKLMKDAQNDLRQLEQYKLELSNSKGKQEAILGEKRQQENILKEELDMKNRLLATLKEKKTYLLYKQSELEEEIKKEEALIQRIIEEQRKKGIYAGTFIWPVKGPITSPFGMRFHPILHVWRMHDGIDIGVPTGTPVKAAASGTVTAAKWLTGYGNVVIISHGQNFSTLYAHLKSFLVKEGEEVEQGQVIAYSDNTGWSTGPHLHFSIYKIDPLTGHAEAVNPLDYLP